MGKPTGFLEYQRRSAPSREPLERVRDFDEFHEPLPEEERMRQGARCMNCGVPFCQSGMLLHGMAAGCPLHNLIPEWNDEVYHGNARHALSRLLKTNNFPEFTGRVCPAPCEAACLCGLGDAPVSIRDNELAIIEGGYAGGWMQPHPPAVRTEKRVAVVGSGPSGLACADMLNKRGHRVTVLEKNDRPGGLLMYGIPNMKLDKRVVERRVRLMEAEGVEFRLNTRAGTDVSPEALRREFDAVVLCCGAERPRDIRAEGREGAGGVLFAVDFLRQTTKSLLDSGLKDGNFVSARGMDVVVVGGGDTGNDCVGTAIRQGCKSVTQLEMMPCPPMSRAADNPWPEFPRVCKTDYGQEEAIACFGEDPRRYCTTVNRILTGEDGRITAVETVRVEMDGERRPQPVPGSEEILPCGLLLIAAGFLGCDEETAASFGVELSPRRTVKTEAGKYASSIPGVFTAGDMHRGQSLVVWAILEGRECAKEVDTFLNGYSNL
ncbi:MAG TPA: glutamate synthase subunit beta [Candidatus Merdivicinus intestinigallinarum]|nr:glutamate synthase subunit beta [Candidatus Merdivicinus intestinigallinarum]